MELEACRRDLVCQSNNFTAERRQYQQQVGTLQLENRQLIRQIEEISSANTDLCTELQEANASLEKLGQCCSSLRQERDAHLVSLESLTVECQREREMTQRQQESQLTSKANEISRLTQVVQSLERHLEQATKEKCAVEEQLSAQITSLTLEKENLNKQQATVEQENRQLKAHVSAEKEKTCQMMRETTLEHRKEKAALEGRLQFAQAQMKSMQEKLINLTVANKPHALLEHDIRVLPNQLETASKAKDAELDVLQKKYEATEKALVHKEEVIGQYAEQVGSYIALLSIFS